ncbi:MAG: Energy-coupling factor transporter transmembrane protein EcfT [Actinobacteria bacterium 66_15]|nr:MAG: Energy-coupling factor transporter transmembrane protein EcfT [Actinobacteria bacterium 66_15]
MALGQYHKVDSPLHRMDPRFKILVAVVYMLVIFLARELVGLSLALVFLAGAVAASGIPLGLLARSLRPVIAFVVFTFMVNLVFITSGETIFALGRLAITSGGLSAAAFMTTRLFTLFVSTALLGFTTSPVDLADGMEGLLAPFERFGVPAHEISMMMSIALRFIPILVAEKDRIVRAQTARGADFESGNPITRMRAIIPVLTPLFLSAFRHAEDLATAMESRCYHGKEGRTRVKTLQPAWRDWVAVAALTVLTCALVVLRTLP